MESEISYIVLFLRIDTGDKGPFQYYGDISATT